MSLINRWLVGSRGYDPDTKIAIMALGLELPRRDALELAAWIAVVADRPTGSGCESTPGSEFEEILHAIEVGNVKAPVPVEAIMLAHGGLPAGVPAECGYSTSPGYFCKLPEGHPGAHRGST